MIRKYRWPFQKIYYTKVEPKIWYFHPKQEEWGQLVNVQRRRLGQLLSVNKNNKTIPAMEPRQKDFCQKLPNK